MSISLRDFLKQKAAQYAVESEKNGPIIQEWQAGVDRLFAQLEEWLRSADPDGFVRAERSAIEVHEPSLGRYPIQRLNLRAFGKWVGLIPKARKAARRAPSEQPGVSPNCTGRVDMTDEIHRCVLYRFGQGAEESWFVDDAALASELQPLTAALFESALYGYFQ